MWLQWLQLLLPLLWLHLKRCPFYVVEENLIGLLNDLVVVLNL